MQDLERLSPANGNNPANGNSTVNQEAPEESVDPASPKAEAWDRRKLIDQLDNDMKKLLQIEEVHERLVKAREFVANGSVHRIQIVKNNYTVDGDKVGDFLVENGRCRCEGAKSRSSAIKGWCEHRTAVEIFKRDVAK